MKPPYRIPSVAEIAQLEGTKGLTAISTFAGAGGSSTGYRWAGFRVLWASEFMEQAAASYEANWPHTIVDRSDVRTVNGESLLDRLGLDRGDLDLFDGSPPCQPFSMAGKRDKNWRRDIAHGDGTTNRGGSENLVDEWVRLVDELRPRAAVMENVRGMAVGRAKGFLIQTLAQLRANGYNADARLLDAQWLGVPQRRVRLVIIAVRDDVGEPRFPAPLPYRYSIRDACPWIVDGDIRLWGTERTSLDVDNPIVTVVATGAQQNRPKVWIDNTEVGGFGSVKAIDPATDVSPTITASGTRTNTIRSELTERPFLIEEVKRLCGFPDDYQLLGSYADQWARLGNSVPPPMARAVGDVIADLLLT